MPEIVFDAYARMGLRVGTIVAASKVDVNFAFADPLIVPVVCGTISKYRVRETPFVRIWLTVEPAD